MKVMLCQPCAIDAAKELVKDGEWLIEEKLDGVRAYIEDGRLYDRRGKDITGQFPEFTELPNGIVLDGEIVAQSRKFNDVSGRVHLRDRFVINLLAKKSPACFVVFDCVDDAPLPLCLRKRELAEFLKAKPVWCEPVPSFADLEVAWKDVLDNGKEGLILKRADSLYQEGKRSADWVKVKAFKEVIAEFTKYEVHPRGVTIETADGRRVVVNGAQASEVIRQFAKEKVIKAEIQYLPQQDSDAWRFPSFRGTRI